MGVEGRVKSDPVQDGNLLNSGLYKLCVNIGVSVSALCRGCDHDKTIEHYLRLSDTLIKEAGNEL